MPTYIINEIKMAAGFIFICIIFTPFCPKFRVWNTSERLQRTDAGLRRS
jgi:hypothetical protein